jgi:hypothetical protein
VDSCLIFVFFRETTFFGAIYRYSFPHNQSRFEYSKNR